MSETLQLLIAIAILIGFAALLWRGGGANPVGTGSLQRQLNTIGAKVGRIEEAQKNTCSASDLEALRGEMRSIEKRAASSGEILALEGQLQALRVEITAAVKAADRTEAGVQRIEGYFLERGIKGQ